MAAKAGRQIEFRWGDESPMLEIEGVREKGIELNGEAIDISSDDDNGWRSLLSVPAENMVNISLSGVSKSRRLQTAWFSNDRTAPARVTYPDGSVIAGNFYLATYNETANYKDAVSFEATLQSTGVVTFTPGSP